jgi:hypothetical protein
VQDDEIFFRDGPPSPQSRPTSPGPDPDIDSESDPQPQPPAPEAARRRAVAHVRPISISDIVRDVSGPDPMRVIRDFDRIYMPEGGVVVHSVVAGQPGDARRSELKRKAENITRSYSEVFAMLTSGNSSQAEAARLLKTITNVTTVFVSAVRVLDKMFVFFQLKFSPADIPHTSLRTMAKNVRRAMMPECEIYKIELAEGEKRL